jgi:hypothetical protein
LYRFLAPCERLGENSRLQERLPELLHRRMIIEVQNIRTYQQIAVISAPVRDFYLVRFWSPRRSGVTLATTHKAGFFDPGGWHSA